MKAIPKIIVILSLSGLVIPAAFCSAASSNYQDYSLSAENFLSTSAGHNLLVGDFMVVGADTLAYDEAHMPQWEYAWQEYGVSQADTVWFDDFLVVGADTLAYDEVYALQWEYAWQEYGVSPADTIWFDDFLVTGADTLSYEQAYQTKRGYSGWNNSMAYDSEYYVTEPFHWSFRLLRFHMDVNYHGRYHASFRTGTFHDDCFNPDSPFCSISPISRWLEYSWIITNFDAERFYYNYQYYMGHPPVAAKVNQGGRDASHEGSRRGFIGVPVLSAVLKILSLN